MKWLIALAFASVVPVAAQAQVKEMPMETVGAWKVSGKGGDCLVGFMTPQGMLMIASPATTGENQGGMMIAKPGLTVADGPGQPLQLSGPPTMAGERRAIGYSDMPGYWLSFPAATTIDAFPDSWRFKVTKDGATVVDLNVTGFVAARAALRRCVQQTS
ncbi:hypothetical protein P1X14_01330 [Sphingomonas sp. AOB5]|uniref:hypothetical protein n=1 Tax=Sphingomonas sp. AOB5 TaxID=3034017 RepID=UPI0023F6B319|nr:hypothetical protein [Sphingomonas sp. AOB5]MDF7773873.1 hypothetical protein [Sphingomonas sp. AOB5]